MNINDVTKTARYLSMTRSSNKSRKLLLKIFLQKSTLFNQLPLNLGLISISIELCQDEQDDK